VIRAHSVEDVRAAEGLVMEGVPEGALMQRAAAGLATAVLDELRTRRGRAYGGRVVLLVGAGSNGGDALWAGARLLRRGVRVDAVLLAGRAHEEGLAAFLAAGGRSTAVADSALERSDVVVDGVLGIGGRPGLPDDVAALADRLPHGVPVVAVDLPSGVDPGTGECPAPFLRATRTVTFGTAKPCLLLPPADRAAGRVDVVDIGLGRALAGRAPAVERLEAADLAAAWPVPGAGDDKYRRGVVGVVAGGHLYTGAAVLACGAAVRSGAGMVRYVGPAEPTDRVRARWPEVVPGQGRVQAWVLGPGVDPDADDGQPDAVRAALASGLPCVVDAGALALLPDRVDGPVLLTPHAGELARLLSARGADAVERADVESAPLRHARRAAELTGATVLLKGATTMVVTPDGRVRSQADAPHWMATAGSGDVLAGLAGALLAAGLEPLDAGSVAAAVHGRAGRRASGGGPIAADDVLAALGPTVVDLLTADGC
jgi:ADP-dependent NAD(P)H-hydrate dehydratase / NAD(P)H-hydrate epimerase